MSLPFKQSHRGISDICVACLLSAGVATLIQFAQHRDGHYSGFVNSLIRVLANVVFVAGQFRMSHFLGVRTQPVQRQLWLWGFFGAATVFTFFDALSRIPSGQVALIYAGHTFILTLFRPLILGQKNSTLSWIAILGGLSGLYLVAGQRAYTNLTEGTQLLGIIEAVASAVFAALAFLMVSKIGKSAPTRLIMSYWFFTSLVCHLGMMLFIKIIWPHDFSVWALLITAGLMASLSQFLTARAFQELSATRAAALTFLAPVFTLATDATFFGLIPSITMLVGTLIILLFGVYLPIQHSKV